ncbi:MAG: SIMPL domain-containing protein, partial [Patescibacteria group bacterium]
SSASGLTFSVEDEDNLKDEARNKAIADAKDKAEKLTKALGVRLVKVVSFYEEGEQPSYYGMDAMSAKGGFEGSAPSPRASVSPGENKYSSIVNVTYEIR